MEHTKSDIANILKKNKRTIQYWTDFGLVVPDIVPSQGRGTARVYSDKNLVQFAMTEYLGQLGVDLNTIKQVMNGLRKGYYDVDFGEEIEYLDEYGKLKKASKERIEFSDFFENREWGEVKELYYLEYWRHFKLLSRNQLVEQHHLFGIILWNEQDFSTNEEVPYFPLLPDRKDLFHKVLWLGQIKIYAVKDLLGMDSLLSV